MRYTLNTVHKHDSIFLDDLKSHVLNVVLSDAPQMGFHGSTTNIFLHAPCTSEVRLM